MIYKISGTAKEISPKVTGTGKTGNPYEIIRFVLVEDADRYPETLEFRAFNRAIDVLERTSAGDRLDVTFSLRGREYNERWYTDLDVLNVANLTKDSAPKETEPKAAIPMDENPEDLPF